MDIKIFHVVGDRFADFAATYEDVVRISDVIAAMRSGDFRFGAAARFVAGQGLSPERESELLRTAEETGRSHHMRLWTRRIRADRGLPHKGQATNVSITTPVQVGDGEFVCDLALDENDCIVGDRLTAQHLQGMVLVEAARQMHVAVAEEFYIKHLPPDAPKSFSFALAVLNHTFLVYAYPVALQFRLRTLAADTRDTSRMHFHSLIDAVQAGDCIFQQEVRSIVFPRPIISALEIRAGRRVLDVLADEHASGADAAKDQPAPVALGA